MRGRVTHVDAPNRAQHTATALQPHSPQPRLQRACMAATQIDRRSGGAVCGGGLKHPEKNCKIRKNGQKLGSRLSYASSKP